MTEGSETYPDIIILLDCSASMEVMGQEPVQALNIFLKEQKKLGEKSLVSLYEFNSEIRVPIKDVPLEKVEPYKNFACSGMTRLYDCIVKAISDTEKKRNTVLVIITDGEDTLSNTPRDEASSLIRECEQKYNWQVTFLAANISARENGASLNISRDRCMNFAQTSGNLSQLMRCVSERVTSFRNLSQKQENASLSLPFEEDGNDGDDEYTFDNDA